MTSTQRDKGMMIYDVTLSLPSIFFDGLLRVLPSYLPVNFSISILVSKLSSFLAFLFTDKGCLASLDLNNAFKLLLSSLDRNLTKVARAVTQETPSGKKNPPKGSPLAGSNSNTTKIPPKRSLECRADIGIGVLKLRNTALKRVVLGAELGSFIELSSAVKGHQHLRGLVNASKTCATSQSNDFTLHHLESEKWDRREE
eukprot:Gb_02095 [translate_table: standard]